MTEKEKEKTIPLSAVDALIAELEDSKKYAIDEYEIKAIQDMIQMLEGLKKEAIPSSLLDQLVTVGDMAKDYIPVSVIDDAIIDLLQQRDKNELKDQVWNQTQMLNAMVNKLIEIKKEAIPSPSEHLELTDSEQLTLVYILGQDLPYAQGRINTDNEERKKNAEIILHDIESILLKLEQPRTKPIEQKIKDRIAFLETKWQSYKEFTEDLPEHCLESGIMNRARIDELRELLT